MDTRVRDERKRLVDEALTWLGTPYHHTGRVKGGGTDCGMLILQAFINTGLIADTEVEYYPIDWHLHRSAERYLGWVMRYCRRVERETPFPGDIVVYRYGRCISHGALVIDWPRMIHAYLGLGVVLADGNDADMQKRQSGIYSYWG